tara:strand:+ start:104 stop:613 length:510 start_codon:yes stop_codon:yes gene_type:complete
MIDNFLWQYLDINDDLIEDLKYHYMKSLPNNEHFFQSLNIGIIEFMGMEIKKSVLIQVEPYAIGRIHTDYRFDKNFGDVLALNIPLINCQDSITQMWKSDYTPPTQYTDNGQPYNFYDKSRCQKITEFQLTKPVLFRTDIPHSVNNSSNKKRQAISLRFKIDPWHLIGK